LLKEIDKLRKDLEKLETTNKTYQSNLSSKNVIITSLEGKVQSLSAALSSAEISRDSIQIELNSQSGALKTAQEQLQQMKKRCEVVEALGKVSLLFCISKIFF
jgi:chromosome segregation ATPase